MKQKKFISYWLLAGFLLFGFCQETKAQWIRSKDNRMKASEHIKDLEKGILIIRLSSKHNNIQALEKALLSNNLSAKDREQLDKKRNKIRDKQSKTNNEIRYSFDEHYKFSQFRFVYDTAMVKVLSGQSSGYFLNANMAIDSSISIDPNAPLYFLSLGQTDGTETQNLEGYVIYDYKNKTLPKPFPYFVRSAYSPTNFLNALVGKSESQYPNFTKMTLRLNNRLTNYLKQVIYEEKTQELQEELKKLKKETKDEGEG
jgi:hypothetical protein